MTSYRSAVPILVVTVLAFAYACDRTDKPGATQTTAADKPPTPPTPTATDTPVTRQAEVGEPRLVTTYKDVGLATPESVMFDATNDVYLVSNIVGRPTEADGKGFVSRLSPEGKVLELRWIEGGKNDVTLNAPKGMVVAGGTLYVADLDTVRMFDAKTGAPTGQVKVQGASLNDMAMGSDGRVLVSDRTGAVHAIDKDKKVSTVAKGKDLGSPNGLVSRDGKTWVVAGTQLYALDAKGKKAETHELPKGELDGVVVVGDEVFISSWDASAIYRGRPGDPMKPVIEGVKSPADIGYDDKRGRLLVPLFTQNEVRVYQVR